MKKGWKLADLLKTLKLKPKKKHPVYKIKLEEISTFIKFTVASFSECRTVLGNAQKLSQNYSQLKYPRFLRSSRTQ